ncbi:MAG: hypothetical protein Q7S65_01985 [Nanoarchaeota archaeon]|nr:hypothetical protein [Nanoarchaeota archaeon]
MKRTTTLIILLVVLLALLSWVAIQVAPKPAPTHQFFTENSKDWIVPAETGVEVSSLLATRSETRVQAGQQDLLTEDGGIASFFLSGMYHGKRFDTLALPSDFFSKTKGMSITEQHRAGEEQAAMRVQPHLIPGDGVPDGFILARKEEKGIVFYLYIDDDFRSQLSAVNLVWGDDFSDSGTLRERPFSFANLKDGVYVDSLSGASWYQDDPIKGGLLVGDITISTMESFEETESTFMMVR